MKKSLLQTLLVLGVATLATTAFAQDERPRPPRPDAGPPPPRFRENERATRPPGPAPDRRDSPRPDDSRRGSMSRGPTAPHERSGNDRPEMARRDRDFGPPPGGFRPSGPGPRFCPHCGHSLTPPGLDSRESGARRFSPEPRGPAFSPDRNRPMPPREGFGPSRRNQAAPGRPGERGDDRLRHDRRDEKSDRQPPPPPRDERDRKDRRHDDDRSRDQRPAPETDRRR